MKSIGAVALVAALLVSGCSGSSTTPAATTPTPTSPTTETFTSVLGPLGTASHSFTMATAGTISVTLTSAGPNVVVSLGLGAANPSAPGCSLTTSVNASAGSTPQLTTTADAGTYCVAILDIGNAPATGIGFVITILHP